MGCGKRGRGEAEVLENGKWTDVIDLYIIVRTAF